MGLLQKGTSGLGRVSVRGRKRVPNPITNNWCVENALDYVPPTRMSAFISDDNQSTADTNKKPYALSQVYAHHFWRSRYLPIQKDLLLLWMN